MALFAAPGEVDLVVVAAPNVAHVPLARRAVAAGLPVVVDKPFATAAADAAALTREAHAAGVLLTVFQNRRHDGDLRTLRALLDGGCAGTGGPGRVALRPLPPRRAAGAVARER